MNSYHTELWGSRGAKCGSWAKLVRQGVTRRAGRGRGGGGWGNMQGKDRIEIELDAPNVGNGEIYICFGPCHAMCAMLLFRIGAFYRRKQSFNM